MAIDVKDLPPEYQAQALKKLMEQERGRAAGPSTAPVVDAPKKPGKYHNRPDERVTEGGAALRFDSRKEARRYDELCLMLEAGEIRDLKLQAQFTLQEAYTTAQGVRVRAIRYVADFYYERQDDFGQIKSTYWIPVVEDVKSTATRTKTYLVKKKLMLERFGIEIQEV